MKQKANHKSWLLILVLITILVGYVAISFVPQSRRITNLHQDLLAKQDFVTNSAHTITQLKTVEEQLLNTTAYNRTWTKHAPHAGEISILLGKIHALARTSNVEIDHFDPEPAEKYDRLHRLPIEMVYNGQLPSVFKFLSELEQMPQTIWIKKVTIEKENKNRLKTENGLSQNRGFTRCEMDLAIFMDNLEISN
ncbi:MAG: type 4a pilus biogenesis protein PilO [Pirellulales bacterium]|nr:type 4a pilus biogenesis protein PilO [Pirellulales bacterium]